MPHFLDQSYARDYILFDVGLGLKFSATSVKLPYIINMRWFVNSVNTLK